MWIKTEYKGWTIRKGRCGWYGEKGNEESPAFWIQDELKEWIDRKGEQ